MTNEHRPYADEGEMHAVIERIDQKLDRIEAQTLKTNGRVSRLEQFKYGAQAVIAVLVLEAGWAVAVWTGWMPR